MEAALNEEGDGLDGLMELETCFYDDGYRTGLEDGTQAGLIEGKLFGIEKGFEKALEMGRLRGRAMVWMSRLSEPSQSMSVSHASVKNWHEVSEVVANLPSFESKDRLRKQVEALMQTVNNENLDVTNSDDAVATFDSLMVKARNKAKVISNITGEPLSTSTVDNPQNGIEDARGISARH